MLDYFLLGCYALWCGSAVPVPVLHNLFHCNLLFFPEQKGSIYLSN